MPYQTESSVLFVKANNGEDENNSNKSQQLKKWCRITGILYTIIIIFGIYADVGVRENYINFTSATETASNIETHALQFRSTVLFELIMCCSDVGVAILLSAILYSVDTTNIILIALMATFRLMQTSIIASNLLHSFAASLILDPSFDAVTVAGSGLESFVEQDADGEEIPILAQNLALLFLSIQKYGYTLALVFFGLSLFFLGMITIIMIERNNVVLFPKMLGWACILAGIGYVLDAIMFFSWSGYDGQISGYFMLPVFVAEFWLAGWLLLVKEPTTA